MSYTNEYDSFFIKYAERYFPKQVAKDPMFQLYFKAQSIAESALNPFAKSPVGAEGLMQLMPKTFAEVCGKLQITNAVVTNPVINIKCGIYYDSTLWGQWKAPRPFVDKLSFMWASYNAGLGNILKAQKWAIENTQLNPNLWDTMVKVAPNVKSWKSVETIGYVKNILKYYNKLKTT